MCIIVRSLLLWHTHLRHFHDELKIIVMSSFPEEVVTRLNCKKSLGMQKEFQILFYSIISLNASSIRKGKHDSAVVKVS